MSAFVLALAGPPASGKTSVARALSSSYSAPLLGFGDLVRYEASRRGLPADRDAWQALGTRLVRELVAEGMARAVLDRAGVDLGHVPVIWDGVRHVQIDDALRGLYAPAPVLLVVLRPPERERRARLLAEAGTVERLRRWERHETESHLDELASRAASVCAAPTLADAIDDVQRLVATVASAGGN